MKQLLIQILSVLVGSENEIEVKKPNINFKNGFRRLFLVIIFSFTIINYVLNGCILDESKLINNTYIQSQQTHKELKIRDFAKIYLEDTGSLLDGYYSVSNKTCSPYKQICEINGVILKTNIPFYFNSLNSKFNAKNMGIVKMPSRLQYFGWQFLDLIIILFMSSALYLIYLSIEKTFMWIIAGFKRVDKIQPNPPLE